MVLSYAKQTIARSAFAKSVGTLVSASVVAQLVVLAATPLTTRLYGPADFGAFAVFTAIFALVLVVSSFRYELAVPLPRSDANAFGVLSLALCLNCAVALLVAPAVVIWRAPLAQLLNAPELSDILWILPIAIIGAGSYRAFRLWAVRRHEFGTIARTRIVQSIAMVVVQIGAGFAGFGGAGLAAGYAVGQTSGAFRLAAGTGHRFAGTQRSFFARMKYLARRYDRFPKYDVAAALIDTLSVQLPNLLLALLFSPAIAGFYMLGERVLAVPLGLLSQSIGQVLYARSRKAVEVGRISELAMKLLLAMSAFLALPVLIMFLAGEPLFAFAFGEAWREAGLFASWLTIGLFGQFLFSSISLVLMATNAQNINLMLQSMMLVLRGAALLYGFVTGSALGAIIALSLANLVGYLFACVVIIGHTRTHDAKRSAPPLADGGN
ncbi:MULTISPECIES: lipopolysaccharide biosynthesis protein [Mesorhizobium]|uniref:lipopolysaccharide biosynthesis protein n=1 Tax=Mesorhizobium TaxID=68287 RepID=UPI00148580B5|nr:MULTISPECIES: oligosaccharide flippase family protein [Mesorhizobium]